MGQELLRAATEMADIIERFTDAVERETHDIGGESTGTVLREMGPAYERLRAALNQRAGTPPVGEIGALVERLRRALEPFAIESDGYDREGADAWGDDDQAAEDCWERLTVGDFRRTRNAMPALEAFAAHQDPEALFEAIKHGDDEHQAWLKEAIANWFAGKPVPAPRGSGNKEARIAALEARLRGDKPEVGL